jgi:hypothetical protein
MALFQLNMASIALELARHDSRYVPFVQRFGQHFVIVSQVLQQTGAGGIGLWQDEDQFYFDVIRHGATRLPLRIYSMVGLVPMFAAAAIEPAILEEVPVILRVASETLADRQDLRAVLPSFVETGAGGRRLLSIVDRERLTALLGRVLDEDQFLSEYGVRSLSRVHRDRPYRFTVDGVPYEVAYRPGVSDNRMFGGNSNWRGPIWFPMNVLLIQAIATFARYYGDSFTIEHPRGSGVQSTLPEIAADLSRRLTRIFLRDETNGGKRPVFGDQAHVQTDPHWRDYVPFHEFFHGETGAGLGASHQTGWTALVALLLQYGGNLCFDCMTSLRTGPSPYPLPGIGERV